MADIKSLVAEGSDHTYEAADAQLLKDAVKLQFNKPLGLPVDNSSADGLLAAKRNFPGICSLVIAPIPGISSSATSTLNVATQSEYAYLRNMLKRANNYDKEDLMIYQLCVDSIVYTYYYGLRAFEAISTYSATNRYYGDNLVKAMGFDPSTIVANLAQARSDLTLRARKLVNYVVPSQISIFARHAWLFRHVYADMKINKCQMYLFRPFHYYTFDLDSSGAGMAKATVFPNANGAALLPWSQYLNILDAQINAIYGDEDAGNISADILTAFGDNIISCEIPSEDPVFIAKSVDDVLTQIQNAVLVGDLDTPSLNLTQTTAGGMTCSPVGIYAFNTSLLGQQAPENPYANNDVLNMYYENPSDIDILKATRFIVRMGAASHGSQRTLGTIVSAGTEIAVRMLLYYLDANNNWNHLTLASHEEAGVLTLGALSILSMFDWHPKVTFYQDAGAGVPYSSPLGGWGYEFMDYSVYAPLSTESLQSLHEVALVASFSVPSLGIFGKK